MNRSLLKGYKPVLKVLAGILLLVLAVSYLLEIWNVFNIILKNLRYEYAIFVGGALYWGLLFFIKNIFKRDIGFIRTFNHEIIHVVFSVLSLNKISSLNVTSRKGGAIRYHGKSNVIISLSPYCVPLIALILLLLKLVVRYENFFVFDVLIGIGLMFHIDTAIKQTGAFQSDLQKHGVLWSYIFIICINIILCGFILAATCFGFYRGWDYIQNGITTIF